MWKITHDYNLGEYCIDVEVYAEKVRQITDDCIVADGVMIRFAEKIRSVERED